jgi:3-oxoacyl-[acyl-carrier protein] reductase
MPRTALLTGGSRGIGKAIGERLAADGVRVVAPSRAQLDLAQGESIVRWLEQNRGLTIDILVNNAGINELGGIGEIRDEAWDAMLQTNLSAPLALSRALLPLMAERGWGRVVNLASVWAVVGRERRGGYAATKAALCAITRVAAVEFAKRGVLVNAVAPGFIATELTYKNNSPADIAEIERKIPMGRLGKPEEIAELVRWLCSESNSYVTGQTILADGGYTLV